MDKIRGNLIIFIGQVARFYEEVTPHKEQPAPYSPSFREDVFSETHIQPCETLCAGLRRIGFLPPDMHKWCTQHLVFVDKNAGGIPYTRTALCLTRR